MTDEEMLKLAAKAAGIPGKYIRIDDDHHPVQIGIGDTFTGDWWNPLDDDGDALRLAVTLRLAVFINHGSIVVEHNMDEPDSIEPLGNDPYVATRRAITRAAAEIGKTI